MTDETKPRRSTEGGSLNVGRTMTLLADAEARAVPVDSGRDLIALGRFCSDIYNSAAPSPAEPQASRRWPFVESPGAFTNRLLEALQAFNGDMLAAVRNVLIENPPQAAQPLTEAQIETGAAEPRSPVRDPWRAAIDNELANQHSAIMAGESPKAALDRALDWAVQVALDPAVSEEAAALLRRGQAEARAALELVARLDMNGALFTALGHDAALEEAMAAVHAALAES